MGIFSPTANQEYVNGSRAVRTRQTFSNADVTVAVGTQHLAQTGTLSAPRTVTLRAANSVPAGFELLVVDESGSATSTNKLTAARAGTDTINGGTTLDVAAAAYGSSRLVSDGVSKWIKV